MNGFKYDMHVHTSETSPCGMVKAAEAVRMYKREGYHGIVITDHYFDGFFESLPRMSWKDKIDSYLKGYRNACLEGARLGLEVLLGMEIRFTENWNDYLVYGLDEEFLYENPDLYGMGLAEFRRKTAGRGILIFQAHPYRVGIVAADPGLLDGVEVFNGNPRHNSTNEKAAMFAAKNGLAGISGSDFHQPQDVARGGIVLPWPPGTSRELAEFLKSGKEFILLKS